MMCSLERCIFMFLFWEHYLMNSFYFFYTRWHLPLRLHLPKVVNHPRFYILFWFNQIWETMCSLETCILLFLFWEHFFNEFILSFYTRWHLRPCLHIPILIVMKVWSLFRILYLYCSLEHFNEFRQLMYFLFMF